MKKQIGAIVPGKGMNLEAFIKDEERKGRECSINGPWTNEHVIAESKRRGLEQNGLYIQIWG